MDLIRISYIRYLSEQLSIEKVHVDKNTFAPIKARTTSLVSRNREPERSRVYVFDFRENNRLTAFGVVNAKAEFGGKFFAHMGAKPFIRLTTDPLKEMEQVTKLLEILVENSKRM